MASREVFSPFNDDGRQEFISYFQKQMRAAPDAGQIEILIAGWTNPEMAYIVAGWLEQSAREHGKEITIAEIENAADKLTVGSGENPKQSSRAWGKYAKIRLGVTAINHEPS